LFKISFYFQIDCSLIKGENKIKGLIHFCGKKDSSTSENSHITCATGFRLFYKLLDFEFNKDAETFLKIFSNGSPALISNLKFSD